MGKAAHNFYLHAAHDLSHFTCCSVHPERGPVSTLAFKRGKSPQLHPHEKHPQVSSRETCRSKRAGVENATGISHSERGLFSVLVRPRVYTLRSYSWVNRVRNSHTSIKYIMSKSYEYLYNCRLHGLQQSRRPAPESVTPTSRHYSDTHTCRSQPSPLSRPSEAVCGGLVQSDTAVGPK